MGETEEEYEGEKLNENGEPMLVIKKRPVTISKYDSVNLKMLAEKEEEFKKGDGDEKLELIEVLPVGTTSFEEIEKEFEEGEVDINGDTITVTTEQAINIEGQEEDKHKKKENGKSEVGSEEKEELERGEEKTEEDETGDEETSEGETRDGGAEMIREKGTVG